MFDGDEPTFVDCFSFLGSWLTRDGSTVIEVSTDISRVEVMYARLIHSWGQPGISLKLRGRVCCVEVHSVLLNGYGIWSLRRLDVFDHRCWRSIVRVGSCDRVISVQVRNRVLCTSSEITLTRCIKLGHLLLVANICLSYYALFAFLPGSGRSHLENRKWHWLAQWEIVRRT